MLLVSVLVVGAIAVVRLPQAFLPDVDAPFIGIEIPYPNSNPTQVEKEITKPVEEVLSTLPSIKPSRLDLERRRGLLRARVRLGPGDRPRPHAGLREDGADRARAAGRHRPVRIFSFSTSDIPVIQGRLSATGVDLSESYDLIESRIANRLRRVPGVARVDLGGVAPKEISIDLVLDRIVEHGVDVGELIARLRGATATLVLGEVT
jgi:hydrophobic/amphiphilic exporter-1 (mainly G- bacteria), HAE1 family